MRTSSLLILLAIAGFLLGIAVSSSYQGQNTGYCTTVEQQIKANQSFSGSVGCYKPGKIEANISEKVEQNADLRCVCRIIDSSGIRIFPVAFSR